MLYIILWQALLYLGNWFFSAPRFLHSYYLYIHISVTKHRNYLHYTTKASVNTCTIINAFYASISLLQGKRISCSSGILIHNIPRQACYTQYRCGSVFFTQPLDLIKNRMQLSGKHNDCSIIELSRYTCIIFAWLLYKLGQTIWLLQYTWNMLQDQWSNILAIIIIIVCIDLKYVVPFALYISLLPVIDFIQYVALHWMWHPY